MPGGEVLMVPEIDPPPRVHLIAASSSAVPLAFRLAAVSSNMKNPRRRAGAVRPGMTAPVSYPNMAVLAESFKIVATEMALARGSSFRSGERLSYGM